SSKYFIDQVLGQHRVALLWPLVGAVGLATLVQAATGFALSQVVSIAGQRAIADMRRDVAAHVLRLPVAYFDSTKTGVLISRIMSDAEGVRNLVGTGIIQLVGGLFTATLAMAYLFWKNWALTAAVLVVLLAFAGAMSFAFKKLRPIFRERSVLNAEVTGRLTEALGGIRTVKVYVAEKREDRVFARGVHKLFRNIAKTITGTSAVGAFSTSVVGAIGLLVMLVGARAVLAGTMSVGDLVSYVFFVGLMAAPLISIASIGTQITEAFAGLDRIREIRSMPTERMEDGGRGSIDDVAGDVVFDGVTFEYVDGVPVLKDVSFHAPAGTTTALVGPSGSGKSTLISLVMGFNRPKSGRVFVDGRDLATIRLGEYRRFLGAVLQDNFLFDGTIYENIAFAKPGATAEEVRAAARIAHCDEFVSRFEQGYDTIVGERGVKLSGGQRQRVAIARAILADPRILILDEATSSLDSESEAMIRDGLRNLRHGRTTFVIAHRLSTIRSADQILVLDEGRIVERGTHDELLELGGLYRRLYERQAGVELDRFINPGEDPTRETEAEAEPVVVLPPPPAGTL
ncbi:MAG: ABC transporter ATP-binding protein, partial [Gemmatimonadetes bacterium]|nr:ABC transporter ATP-binding protein [Gemmatimonadota bacterium]